MFDDLKALKKGYFLLGVIFTLLIFYGCTSTSNPKKAEIFSSCFNTQEQDLLSEGMVIFESIMKEYYPDSDDDEIYQVYLDELAKINLPVQIIVHPKAKEYLLKLKKEGVFSEIYSNKMRENMSHLGRSYYEHTSQENTEFYDQGKTPYYYIVPSGKFLECLLSLTKNEDYKSFLLTMKREPDVSPDMRASGLRHLKKEMINESVVQFYIVYGLYYETILTLSLIK